VRLLQVGLRDLHDGLKSLDAVMVGGSMGNFAAVQFQLAMLLVAGVLGGAALLLLLVRPFARSLRSESEMVAELLSQLPHELDTTGLVKAAIAQACCRAVTVGSTLI
jgi:hypothetical protein